MSQHGDLAVALDVAHRTSETCERVEHFARHGTGNDIAADHDLVDLFALELVQHRLERRKISVNVVEGSDTHGRPACVAEPVAARTGRCGCSRPELSYTLS